MATVERINPPGLFELEGFSQVVLTQGEQHRLHRGPGALRCRHEPDGRGDLHAQTVQAFRNLRTALQALGVGPDRVVSSTMYVVGLDEERSATFVRAMNVALDGEPFPPNASSLIGVARLGHPEMLVEISAIAVLD